MIQKALTSKTLMIFKRLKKQQSKSIPPFRSYDAYRIHTTSHTYMFVNKMTIQAFALSFATNQAISRVSPLGFLCLRVMRERP